VSDVVKQQRAERTYRALVRAAAVEIDRNGYAGTSLLRVSQAAGISVGALTFHFATKNRMAAAVEAQGSDATRSVAARAACVPASALHRVGELILTTVRLLEKEPLARAAARLGREHPCADGGWTAAWLPAIRELVRQAHAEGQLRPGADPETVTMLAAHLVTGAEARLREQGCLPTGDGTDVTGPLARLWDCVLYGISTDGQTGRR
jgi:AcrR family transcriptional regulator